MRCSGKNLFGGKVNTASILSPRLKEPSRQQATLLGHIQIARADHWVKNVFVLPGLIVALSLDPAQVSNLNLLTLLAGFAAICLITSSNYVINEVLDGPFDRLHPTKHNRPVPSGRVNVPLAYVQWIVLMLAGMGIAFTVSKNFAITLTILWIMGCLYNIPPIRSKDLPYLDVLTESVNNPLRMLAGWYLTETRILPPSSLLISYWMIGCYFMAIKRWSEYRDIGDPVISAAYRRSFAFYNEQKLLVSIMFYGTSAMLFFGAFVMRYRLELILAFPLVALVMTVYLSMSFKADSAAQRPEVLYREPGLMTAVFVCTVLMVALLFIDIPILHTIFVDYPKSRMQ
jgi:decaprenyl-phosphate phosphoribosyltransferase